MADQGIFKEYDMAMMVHLYDQNLVYCTLNGLASYMYNFHGKASHAGAAPWDGQNALNAAQLMSVLSDTEWYADVKAPSAIRREGRLEMERFVLDLTLAPEAAQ